MSLANVPLEIMYSGPGQEIARRFLMPVLRASVRYDRLSGYFTVRSFVAVAAGLEGLRRNGGTMRLVVGAHDQDEELRVAANLVGGHGQVIEDLRRRLLAGVSTLTDELERDRIATVAWMLQHGFLSVKCALPRDLASLGTGIFHSKRFVFVDAHENLVTATGSPNETASGLGGNYEDITVHRSWTDQEGYTTAHASRFEQIWEGRDPYLHVLPVNSSFGDDLMEALHRGDRPSEVPLWRKGLVDALTKSPLFAVLNSSDRPLYPHQERVLVEAASRWPIRVLLADEVGLGKTFEAAALVRFAINHAAVKRVLIIVPPGLLRQWQDELATSFGMRFDRYESGQRRYIDPDGGAGPVMAGPFAGDWPELALVSKDLVRGTRRTGHLLEGVDLLPDLVVVDEAHALRQRRDPSGGTRESLLRRAISHVATRVPHLVFLTATPLQMHATELLDILELLGVPPGYTEAEYERSLRLLSSSPDVAPDLDDVAHVLRQLDQVTEWYQPHVADDAVVTRPALQAASNGVRRTIAARAEWRALYGAFVRLNVPALLTLRNTRGALSRIGYSFPERDFESVETTANERVRGVLSGLDAYLSTSLGEVEKALFPDRRFTTGFMVTTYRQRVASSLRSAYDSLTNRRGRIEELIASDTWHRTEGEDAFDEEEDVGPPGVNDGDVVVTEQVLRACAIELAEINHVLGLMTDLGPEVESADPKMEATLDRLRHHLAAGSACLVFSRYTSTVRSLIHVYRQAFGDDAAFAVFTGDGAEVWDGARWSRGRKQLVIDALERRTVSVVFCSDAASEGLNLQAASVVINVDVPWNPARLEQRIGRVARLGQREARVTVVNVWYPGTVEATIYARLLARKDLLEVAVGAYPQLVSDSISRAVRSRYSGVPDSDLDVIEQLQNVRESIQLEALRRVWEVGGLQAEVGQGTRNVRTRLARVLSTIDDPMSASSETAHAGGTTVVGVQLDPSKLTLSTRRVTELLLRAPVREAGGYRLPLYLIERGGRPLLFAVKERAVYMVLRPDAVPELLEAVYLAKALDADAAHFLEAPDEDGLRGVVNSMRGWWPNLTALSPKGLEKSALPRLPAWADESRPITLRYLLSVPVAKEGHAADA